jgi:hypothetical protein
VSERRVQFLRHDEEEMRRADMIRLENVVSVYNVVFGICRSCCEIETQELLAVWEREKSFKVAFILDLC